MSFPEVDRYSQMIRSIVGGPFYESLGVVVPLRSGVTPLRLETTEVSVEFGIYINDSFSGTVISGLDGSVTFSKRLPQGEVVIACKSRSSGREYRAYVTVREWANWLAAYSECLEVIDDGINQVRSNMSVSTADLTGLQDLFGSPLSFYQDVGQGIEAYRDQIQTLKAAYRNFGGTYKGLDESISAITSIDPLSYSRKYWGPNWVVDQTMLVNNKFTDRSATLSSTGNITGVEIIQTEADVLSSPTTPHQLDYDASTNELLWTPDGSAGISVFAADGELFLPGPLAYSNIYALGREVSSSYHIYPSYNNTLYLNIDELGISTITLTSGLLSVAAVVSQINSALLSDLRYGASYASVYNGRVLITGTTSVEICPGVRNAGPEIFGVKPSDLIFAQGSDIPGVYLLKIEDNPSSIFQWVIEGVVSFYNSSVTDFVPYFRWKSDPGDPYGGNYLVESSGYYTFDDSVGRKLYVYIDFDELQTATTFVDFFSIGYDRRLLNDNRSKGLWVSVNNALLPSSNQTDTITVYDDVTDGYVETPDYWFVEGVTGSSSSVFVPSTVVNDRLSVNDPCTAFKYRFTDSSLTAVSFIGHAKHFPLVEGTPRGSNGSFSIPGLLYDYEGYNLKFSTWLLSLNSGAITATLKISFDGGDNWVSGTATPITEDASGLGIYDFTYVELELPVSSLIKYRDSLTWEDSGVLVGIDISKPTGSIDLFVDFPNLQVKYISSGYLGNATVVRSLHRQYLEDLSFLWSKEPLTLNEKKYLGLTHSIADKTTPYAGVLITEISNDTPTGNGTLEYDYTSIGTIKKLRWTPYGTVWGSGLGYVTIPSDGTYTLTAPDGSYLSVTCTFDILPTDSRTRTINISDETTYRGQTRNVSPCYTSLDIHDVTEYDSSGNCKNLIGVIDEADFSLCGLVNCDIASRNPFKYSFVYPEYENGVSGEILTLSLVGFNRTATLDYYSDQDQVEATLYADDIPVPNDLWSFSLANEISIPDSVFTAGTLSLSSVFTIDYNLIYQVTSTVLEMNTANPLGWSDYAWWADYSMFNRYDSIQGSYDTTTQLFFNVETGRATLINRSAANKSMSKLMLQQAYIQREIPKSYWRFIDDFTVEIDLNYYVDGQYYLEHQELRVYEEDSLTVLFEHRSGVTSTACISASWETIEKNESVNIYQSTPHPYHQLRLSVSGIRDLRDFKIRSMVIKGLNLRGSGSIIPGFTNTWLGA